MFTAWSCQSYSTMPDAGDTSQANSYLKLREMVLCGLQT